MQTEYDDSVLDYWKLPNGNYSVKKDEGLDGDIDIKHTLPSRLGAFVFCNTTRNMSFFI